MRPEPAHLVVVMGVSGCGKSTVGALLAHRIGAEFLEGDALHPPRNVERMAAGVPLTDADRGDWLLALARRLKKAGDARRSLVVSCSALKRSYRDVLRTASGELAFVYLRASRALLDARLHARVDHFMPASLLASQLATLEPPDSDERTIAIDADFPVEQIVSRAASWLTGASTDSP